MKRGRVNPAAYSSTEKPAGTLICAPAGRGTMAGAFGFGGACASNTAAREARARNGFILGYHFTRGCRMRGVDWPAPTGLLKQAHPPHEVFKSRIGSKRVLPGVGVDPG